MRPLVLLVALLIFSLGVLGVIAPEALVTLARHSVSSPGLYLIAAARVGVGLVLIRIAPATRAPRTIRLFGLLAILAGVAAPLLGVDRAQAIMESWAVQGSGVVRLTAVCALAAGSFLAYAVTPNSRAA